MKKKFRKISCFLLTALLSALGFGSCCTTKKAAEQSAPKPDDAQPAIEVPDIKEQPAPIKVVYGPPPTRYISMPQDE